MKRGVYACVCGTWTSFNMHSDTNGLRLAQDSRFAVRSSLVFRGRMNISNVHLQAPG